MHKKSLSVNAILNIVKTLVNILFPLITFPYASRVLGVENIGKINFSSSIVSYFALIAAFGISTYAIREGSRYRENKKKIGELTNQIFTINVFFTCFTYLLLIILIIVSGTMRNYALLIAIHSATILFSTLGADWLNTIYEDFAYITIRTLAFQVLSLILMFLLVHNPSDYYVYAIITVLSSAGGNISNFFYCRKYAKIRLVKKIEIKKHFRPMSLFFLSNISTIVFLNSDLTMIGIISGAYYVGIYSLSVKIYNVVKTIFTAILTVVLPRMSYIQGNGTIEERHEFMNNILNIFLIVVLPLALGLYLVSDGIVAIIGGVEYIDSVMSLKILSISILGSALASFLTYIVVIPEGKERILLYASFASAFCNVALNFYFIPHFQQNGAAITTAISEIIVFVICLIGTKPHFDKKRLGQNLVSIVFGCLFIAAINYFVRIFIKNIYIYTMIVIFASSVVYFGVLYITKNEFIRKVSSSLWKRFKIS